MHIEDGIFSLVFSWFGPPKSYDRMGSIAFPLRNQKGEELFILANCQKKGSIIAMLCTSQYSPKPPQWVLIAPHRVSEILAAELQQQKLRQFLQPAAYPECELRRIVCWLLIVSAEIWKIYFPDSTFFSRCGTFFSKLSNLFSKFSTSFCRCGTSFVKVYQNKKMQNYR